MPSVLVEVGFICHPEEEKFMTSAAGKEKLATSIFQAFSSYKARIEDRSAFRPSGNTSAEPETKNPNGKALNEVHPETTNLKPKVVFCVQIATTSQPIDTYPNNFNKYRDVERIQTAPRVYKYVVGRTVDYATAQETVKKVRADFLDAFLVCIVEGQIIPLAEGLKIMND
jgi:N-acetylmuramoyl-L-alanine amidase